MRKGDYSERWAFLRTRTAVEREPQWAIPGLKLLCCHSLLWDGQALSHWGPGLALYNDGVGLPGSWLPREGIHFLMIPCPLTFTPSPWMPGAKTGVFLTGSSQKISEPPLQSWDTGTREKEGNSHTQHAARESVHVPRLTNGNPQNSGPTPFLLLLALPPSLPRPPFSCLMTSTWASGSWSQASQHCLKSPNLEEI